MSRRSFWVSHNGRVSRTVRRFGGVLTRATPAGLTSAEATQRLAVGLTLQLLPTLISINLAHGAKRMAHAKVIVTEGSVHIQAALDVAGAPSEKVLLYAYLNAWYETGFTNPIDAAIPCASPA